MHTILKLHKNHTLVDKYSHRNHWILSGCVVTRAHKVKISAKSIQLNLIYSAAEFTDVKHSNIPNTTMDFGQEVLHISDINRHTKMTIHTMLKYLISVLP